MKQAPESKQSLSKATNHFLDSHDKDWGFNALAPLHDVNDPTKNYCVNDTVVVVCRVDTIKPPPNGKGDYARYDSRKETGFVGLKNQVRRQRGEREREHKSLDSHVMVGVRTGGDMLYEFPSPSAFPPQILSKLCLLHSDRPERAPLR